MNGCLPMSGLPIQAHADGHADDKTEHHTDDNAHQTCNVGQPHTPIACKRANVCGGTCARNFGLASSKRVRSSKSFCRFQRLRAVSSLSQIVARSTSSTRATGKGM